MKIHDLSEKLSIQLKRGLPGKDVQMLMVAKPRVPYTFPKSTEQAIPSAVLILLFPHAQDIQFYLTKRTHDVETHKGQISLPGGAWEEGEQLYETALRETNEEIGVTGNDITMIGGLTPLFIPLTGFMIHPFLAWIAQEPKTEPDPVEVETLFSVSIYSLINENLVKNEIRTIHGFPIDIPYFQFEHFKVWGATAMILSEFKAVLKSII